MRRGLTFLLALLLFFGIAAAVPMYASAQSLYVRKIVSVVYDDSGSMIEDDNGTYVDRWCQAKYAMEVFAAMLGEKDTLNIFFMSDYDYCMI